MGIVEYLVEQSGNPSGLVGRLLLTSMDWAHGRVIEKALEPLRGSEGRRVLDVGCGSGYALKIMDRRFRASRLHGMDISATCMSKANGMNRSAHQGNSFSFQLGNASCLPYDEGSMDVVTAFQTHYFWPDIHRACGEIRRVLKPGGMFVLTGDLYKMKYHLTRYQSLEEYPSLLREEGFTDIEVFSFHGFMIAYARI